VIGAFGRKVVADPVRETRMATPRKPDFSKVTGSVGSTEPMYEAVDFSRVQSSVGSTETMRGNEDAATTQRTYTVAKGDTLSHIAKHFYGKAGRWREIFDANRDQLDDPDRIFPGQVLKIPADTH
jgi:nucleoid-associated protein YgaU